MCFPPLTWIWITRKTFAASAEKVCFTSLVNGAPIITDNCVMIGLLLASGIALLLSRSDRIIAEKIHVLSKNKLWYQRFELLRFALSTIFLTKPNDYFNWTTIKYAVYEFDVDKIRIFVSHETVKKSFNCSSSLVSFAQSWVFISILNSCITFWSTPAWTKLQP